MKKDLRFKVNLKGIIDLLSKHIYKTEDVFLRELLQNATDAITARKKEEPDFEGSISLELIEGEESRTLCFTDDGIGLREDDIHKFIATIGQSSKRDLLDAGAEMDFIGHFGIGLLSCFMVSEKIVMVSRHVQEEKGYVWEGLPDGTYSVKESQSDLPIGTTVYLTADKEQKEYFTFEKIKDLLTYYGNLLPFPIYLKEDTEELQVNALQPLWYHDFRPHNKSAIIRYGEKIFQDQFIDAFPISSEAGGAKGVAYVLGRKSNPNSQQLSRIYLKKMFLSELSKDVIPNWAFFVRVILNSDKLTPTASREEFYDNEILEATREELGQSIKKYLLQLPFSDPQLFDNFLRIHGLALKSLAVDDDELFKLLIGKLSFLTSLGYMTGEQIMKYSKTITYSSSLDEFRQVAPVFSAQKELLVNGGYVYDTDLLEKIATTFEGYEVQVAEIDDLLDIMESPDVDTQNKLERLLMLMDEVLRAFDCRAEVKLFQPKELPALFSGGDKFNFYKNISKAREESNQLFSSILSNFEEDFSALAVLCFNLNNKLVKKLLEMEKEEDIKFVVKMLYCQAMIMGHYPLHHGELRMLNEGMLKLLEVY